MTIAVNSAKGGVARPIATGKKIHLTASPGDTYTLTDPATGNSGFVLPADSGWMQTVMPAYEG
ncbi:MAG: hypothetical protein JWP52_476, partial [Rhizobacter sp.]|nr:hypothetical protein [Rhizobacter sp.]